MNYEEVIDKYRQNGGTYVVPVEIINMMIGEIEDLQQENKRLGNIERIFNQMINLGVIEFDKEKNEAILVYDNAMEVIERQNKLFKEENKKLNLKLEKLVDHYINEMTRIVEKQKELKIIFGGNNRANDLLTGKLLMIISSGEILLEKGVI